MKINDIIVEGLWDNLNGAAKAGKAEFQKRQKEDNFQRNMKRFIDGDTALIAKDWNSAQRSLPNYNELIKNPEQYYNAVAKFTADKYKTSVPANINAPAMINPQGAADVIQKVVASFHYARHATPPDQSGAPKEPQTTAPAAPGTGEQPDYHTPIAKKQGASAPAAPGTGEQPDYHTPIAKKQGASAPAVPAAPVTGPQPPASGPNINPPSSPASTKKSPAAPVSPAIKQQAPAAPVSPEQQAPLNFAEILQSVESLSKSEQRKLLGQLLQRTNAPMRGRR